MSHRYFILVLNSPHCFLCRFLSSIHFFFLQYTEHDYNSPIKSNKKKAAPPRNSYIGGDNGNALGEKVVVYLPDGYIFCVFWVDSNLDNSILQFLVSDDGRKIIQRKKKPLPTSASAMLGQVYNFARDPKHMVVAQVEAELNRLKIGAQRDKEWDEETIVDLKEEVLKVFYDVNGLGTNQIQYHRDRVDGRQWISFFVKTVRAQEVPQVGTFCNDDAPMGGGGGDNEDTAEELREEMERAMDARLRQMSRQMSDRQEAMMQQGQENTRKLLEQFMHMNMNNNNNQQQPARSPTSQEAYAQQQRAAAAHQQQLAAAAAAEAAGIRPDNATS
jgi:hypothetical protein